MSRPEDIPEEVWKAAEGQAMKYIDWLFNGGNPPDTDAEHVLAVTIAYDMLGAWNIRASPPSPVQAEPAAWMVSYSDGSVGLALTEEEADDRIAEARPGATKRPLYAHPAPVREAVACEAKFRIGDRVEKISGSSWRGRVVGTYRTSLTPEGYAVESENEPGSVQIYPAAALRAAPVREAMISEDMVERALNGADYIPNKDNRVWMRRALRAALSAGGRT